MYNTVELFKVLSDPTRLRLIRALLDHECCVCELVDALRVTQYNVSRHLAIMKKTRLIKDRREGTWIYYQIAPNKRALIHDLLQVLAEHGGDEAGWAEDEKRLEQRLRMRVEGKCVLGYQELDT